MNLRKFGMALLRKYLWRSIFEDSLWSRSIRMKYMGNKDFSFWYKKGTIGSPHGSAILYSFLKIESFFLQNLSWSLRNGNIVYIGFDPILGAGKEINIPPQIKKVFHRSGIFI